MSIVITDYTKEHHEHVVNIITTIQQKEFHFPITYDDQPDLGDIDGFYDVFLLALYEGFPVGTIGCKWIDDYAMIRKMFVKDDFRGKTHGTAKKLLDTIQYKIKANNLNKIYIATPEFCHAAHRFYEKNGYINISQEVLTLNLPVMKIDTKFYFKGL